MSFFGAIGEFFGGGGAAVNFDVSVVAASWEKCLNNQDLNLDEFLDGCHELCNFMRGRGGIAALAVNDFEGNIQTIRQLKSSSNNNLDGVYDTVKSMVQYEYDQHNTKGSPYLGVVKGIWILRGTNLIVAFIRQLLSESDPNSDPDSTAEPGSASCFTTAYFATLAQHHPVALQQTVRLGSNFLPSRKSCLEDIGDLEMAKKVADFGDRIAEFMKQIYEEKNLYDM